MGKVVFHVYEVLRTSQEPWPPAADDTGAPSLPCALYARKWGRGFLISCVCCNIESLRSPCMCVLVGEGVASAVVYPFHAFLSLHFCRIQLRLRICITGSGGECVTYPSLGLAWPLLHVVYIPEWCDGQASLALRPDPQPCRFPLLWWPGAATLKVRARGQHFRGLHFLMSYLLWLRSVYGVLWLVVQGDLGCGPAVLVRWLGRMRLMVFIYVVDGDEDYAISFGDTDYFFLV